MKSIQNSITELICPKCQKGSLEFNQDVICCPSCQQQYEISNEIPLLFWPEDPNTAAENITNIVKEFYEETPFPNYNDFDSVGSLMQKAKEGIFAKLLDEQLPFGIKVLECGCGTGQLSIFLSIANRSVFGVDMCLNSLKLGQAFKDKYELQRVNFLQMNIFRPIFKPESFDVVISNGVLHHTHNPKLAFSSIAKLVKPGGYIIIGLYHKYGRIWTDVRRFIFNLTGDKFKFLEPRIIDMDLSEGKRKAWFMDQYKHPNECKHTIGDVMGWFAETGFSFVNSIPKSGLAQKFTPDEKLFVTQSPGNALERFLVESSMIFTNSKDGGFFIVIGKKEG